MGAVPDVDGLNSLVQRNALIQNSVTQDSVPLAAVIPPFSATKTRATKRPIADAIINGISISGGTQMMDPIRRAILATGVAATAAATAGTRLFAQTAQGAAMGTYEKGPVRIHFEEAGSGFPLLVIAGGGLNSTIASLTRSSPFNPMDEFKAEYHCIASDLRNANGGQSSGPLEADRPWDSYTDDHLGLMDHLGIDKFMVLGFCIGGPFIWNLLKRAPNRVVAAVLAQPSGSRPEARDLFYEGNMKNWGPELIAKRPEITTEMVDKFLTKMYRTNPDFVFTVTRDFVRQCQTPVLILPDDIPAHPYAVAMEAAMLAPKAEVSMFPWKEPKERIPLAVRQIHSFLRAHRPASA
jgi:pimeloyl-ACP methyl ester carboxylesterase